MYLADSGAGDDFPNVIFANTTPCHHRDPTARLIDQQRDCARPFQRRCGASGGEDTADTGADQDFERLLGIRGAIECSVKAHRQPPRCLDQLANDGEIYPAIGIESAQDDSIGTFCARDFDIPPHYLHVLVRVDEAAAARSNEDEHRNADPCPHRTDQPRARRRATVVEIRAELDAPRSGALGDNCRFESIDSDLDQSQTALSYFPPVSGRNPRASMTVQASGPGNLTVRTSAGKCQRGSNAT